MIFDEPKLADALQDRSVQRVAAVSKLMATATGLFPHIDIRLLESITVVNAQASMLDRQVALPHGQTKESGGGWIKDCLGEPKQGH